MAGAASGFLRAFASARHDSAEHVVCSWCESHFGLILAMTSTSEIRLAGRQRVLAQSICSKSAFTECACELCSLDRNPPSFRLRRARERSGTSPAGAYGGFLTGSVFGESSLLRNEPQYPTKGYAPHSGRGPQRWHGAPVGLAWRCCADARVRS